MQNKQRHHRPSKKIMRPNAQERVQLRATREAPNPSSEDSQFRKLAAPLRADVRPEKAMREPLAKRLNRKRSLVANDNAGRSRKNSPSPTGAARPFGQKVVLFLIWFTIVLLATLFSTTLLLETQLSFGAHLGFSIALACVAACVPVADTMARIMVLSLTAAMIGLYSLFSAGP